MQLRLKKRGEKALEKALSGPRSDNEEDDAELVPGRWKGHPDEDTIEEGEEPPPSAGLEGAKKHRRERAETGRRSEDD